MLTHCFRGKLAQIAVEIFLKGTILAAAVADDIDIAREMAEQHELIQPREDLFACQIARRAKDDDREWHALVERVLRNVLGRGGARCEQGADPSPLEMGW